MQPLLSGQLVADFGDEFLTARYDLKSIIGQPALRLAMERQANWSKPTGDNPMAEGATWLGQAQLLMILGRHCTSAAIDCIVVVPFAQRVGMWSVQWAQLAISGRKYVRYLEVTENAVMALASALIAKQAKKQKHVVDANALVLEVRLSCTALAEQALVTNEHGIFMAEVISRNPAPCNALDNLAKSKVVIGRDRPSAGGNWQADRLAPNDGRSGTTGTGVEPLSTKDYPHRAPQIPRLMPYAIAAQYSRLQKQNLLQRIGQLTPFVVRDSV